MPGLGNHTRSYAVSARSASIPIAPPPASLWVRRNQDEQCQFPGQPVYRARDTPRAADSICSIDVNLGDYHHSEQADYQYSNHGHYNHSDHSDYTPNHHFNHDITHHHLRADSTVLGFEQPRILHKAHVAAPTTPAVPQLPTVTVPLAKRSVSPPLTPYTISEPIGPVFHPKPEDYRGPPAVRPPQRLSALMPLDILPRAHWLSRVRSCLRLLIIVLSGAVVFMLMHTLGIYRGNRYLELRKGEIPMVWPAHTNLAPTIILIAVAGANFLASVAILSLSFKRSFRRPIRSRDLYRIVAGSFGVVLWAAALVVFHLLDKASKASLRRYSCTNASQITNGRYQYRAVCEEQVRYTSPHPLHSTILY